MTSDEKRRLLPALKVALDVALNWGSHYGRPWRRQITRHEREAQNMGLPKHKEDKSSVAQCCTGHEVVTQIPLDAQRAMSNSGRHNTTSPNHPFTRQSGPKQVYGGGISRGQRSRMAMAALKASDLIVRLSIQLSYDAGGL